jgi:hypothetical protein
MTLLACLTGILVTTGALQAQIREARRHFDRANDLVSVSEYEQAIGEFRQTYLVDPWQVNAIYNIARCYERMVEAGESPEMALLHKRRAIDAYKNYLEVSLQVVPKEPLRDKAMASISRLRQDVERIEAERAARLRGEEETEKEGEREARERRALEEEKKALQEKVNRMMAEREEEKAKLKVLRERHRVRIIRGASVTASGLAVAGLGAGLLGQAAAIFGQAQATEVTNPEVANANYRRLRPLDISGSVLTASGGILAILGLVKFVPAARSDMSFWFTLGGREFALGGRF